MAACPAAEGDVTVRILPEHVNRATDGVVPQWRFTVVCRNNLKEAVTLQELQVTTVIGDKSSTASFSGTPLHGMMSGPSKAEPGGRVIILMIDDGKEPTAAAIALRAIFRTAGGAELRVDHTIPLCSSPTVYLRFPLPGRWVVANGREIWHGLGIAFAYDLVTEADWPVHQREATETMALRDFTSWGADLRAPLSATVFDCRSDRPDCEPTPNRASMAGKKLEDRSEIVGNYLILRAPEGHYILMAHLKRGSLKVAKGEKVQEGQLLAEVGNSGNTSGPHLHLEVLDGPPDLVTLDLKQAGLPFGFKDVRVTADGETKTWGRYVPRRNEIVEGDVPR
ncbi:MAG: M23 family metallopeptidase [Armatimonadia bacterium]